MADRKKERGRKEGRKKKKKEKKKKPATTTNKTHSQTESVKEINISISLMTARIFHEIIPYMSSEINMRATFMIVSLYSFPLFLTRSLDCLFLSFLFCF